MIGAALFALASVPGASSLSTEVVGAIYFAGSIFFTAAALEQLRTTDRGDRRDLVASVVQLIGTLLFNLNTLDAMRDSLTTEQQELLVWAPDAIGSACFLIASVLALAVVFGARFFAPARRIARLNLVGSIAFGLSATAAWIVPDTGELLDATAATSMTLLGALLFFYAAFILAVRLGDAAAA